MLKVCLTKEGRLTSHKIWCNAFTVLLLVILLNFKSNNIKMLLPWMKLVNAFNIDTFFPIEGIPLIWCPFELSAMLIANILNMIRLLSSKHVMVTKLLGSLRIRINKRLIASTITMNQN